MSVTPPQAPVAAMVPSSPSKRKSKHRGTGAAAAEEASTTTAPPGKIIIEASIDAEAMHHQVSGV